MGSDPAFKTADQIKDPGGGLADYVPVVGPEAASWIPPDMRDYQQATIERLVEVHHGSAVLPTGVGKTEIAKGAICRLKTPTAIVVPTIPLLEQWQKRLREMGIEPGVWFGDEKRPGAILLSTYQTLYLQPALIRRYRFIIFDEGDLAFGQFFHAIVEEAKHHDYALLLTATPPSDPFARAAMEAELPVLISRTTGEMVQAGWLVPSEFRPMPVILTPEERKAYDLAHLKCRKYQGMLGTANPRTVVSISKNRSHPLRNQAFAMLDSWKARRTVLSNAAGKPAALLQAIERHPGEKILVFSDKLDGLDRCFAFLHSEQVPCEVITGKTPRWERQRILEAWGREFYVLGTAKVLERGIDVPDAAVLVVVGAGTSRLQNTQRVGRVLRPAEGKDRAHVYVVFAQDTIEKAVPVAVRRVVRVV